MQHVLQRFITFKKRAYYRFFVRMARLFYNLFIHFYIQAARLLALFNLKAALWVKGRKHIFLHIQEALDKDFSKRIWIHCASLGEFEQAIPVMEKLKADYPAYSLFLTFFSPSGYEVQKNYKGCDYVFYLPPDTKKNAAQFFDLVQPNLILFIKYELWVHYLQQANLRNIPLLLVSANFNRSMNFFKWYGSLFRSMLTAFKCIFVQTKEAQQLLSEIKIINTIICGDTRFDRVLELLDETKNLKAIEEFCTGYQVLAAGSTWREDDLVIEHYVNTHKGMRFIIAPHNVGRERIKECKAIYKNSMLYSDYLVSNNTNCHTLIIDSIGVLKYLYRYSTISFIGGAFGGEGIHNVLEAAVYGKPVLFGPNHDRFPETFELMNINAAFEIKSAVELEKIINKLLSNPELYNKASTAAADYIQQKRGATSIIMNYIQEKRLLTR